MNAKAAIIPTMRYRDPGAAIEWLCQAFGFAEHQVFKDNDGKVVHAELGYGGSLLMLGPAAETEFGKYLKSPDETGGAVTQCIFVVVDDVDAHYGQAKAAGAEILIDIKTQGYRGRDYTCRDPQGHMWSFGSYDPWAAKQA